MLGCAKCCSTPCTSSSETRVKRRQFLKVAGSTSLSACLPALGATARAPMWDRTVVLIELSGGNDGLNTVVPYADERYYALRPRLAVARAGVLQLSDHVGLNPALEALLPAWRARQLALVQGVGYPQPNRSHFRSIEIWDTGSDSDQILTDGWLTRLFAATAPPAKFATHGIVLGQAGAGPLAGENARTVVLQTRERFVRAAERLAATPSTVPDNPALAHLLAVRAQTRRAAAALAPGGAAPVAEFPASRIGRQLHEAAAILAAGTPVAALKLAHGSFDTHSNQRNTHDRLLRELAEGLAAFRDALIALALWDRVLVLTYSEFGRRAAENASLGTDHGTAAAQFLLGGRVKGGLYGRAPSLARLADGDLEHHVDFRSLYATIARSWWALPADFLRAHPVIDCLA